METLRGQGGGAARSAEYNAQSWVLPKMHTDRPYFIEL